MLTENEKTKMDIIITAFMLAYAPPQVWLDTATRLIEELNLNTVPRE